MNHDSTPHASTIGAANQAGSFFITSCLLPVSASLNYEPMRMARVIITDRLPSDWQGAYDAEQDVILMADNLTPIQYACVLAHEMSHAKHHDSGCHADKWVERRADIEAARMLIDPDEYASAERVCDNEVWLARELEVMPWVVRAYREYLHDIAFGVG